MKKRILLIVLILTASISCLRAAGTEFRPETLHYNITYKWGLIDKVAGTATLSLSDNSSSYRLMLTARTKPWTDKVFQVRDTLKGTVSKTDFRPTRYVKIAHEGSRYSLDDITYTYSGSAVKGTARRVRVNKKGERSESSISLSSTGKTFDMLSVFYYLRTLDFKKMSNGTSVKVNIFSGKQTETVTIRCTGKERITLHGSKGINKEAWHIKFQFTSGGGKKSSDDIDAWISTDPQHVPLQVFGKLPIGQVRVYLQQ